MGTQQQRRILRQFTIDELSNVDQPAQAGATMVLMKRESAGGSDMNEQIEQAAKAAFPNDDRATAVAKYLDTTNGRELYRRELGASEPTDARLTKAAADAAERALDSRAELLAARDGVNYATAYTKLLNSDEGRALYKQATAAS